MKQTELLRPVPSWFQALVSDGFGSYDSNMEARAAKLESDVSHIKDDIAEIKGLLARLAPAIDRIDGFLQATMPTLATKLELADLKAELKGEISDLRVEQTSLRREIERRPTHRQIVLDLFALAAFVSAVAPITARVVH